MDQLKEWWQQASSKDQLYLVILAGSVGLYILYMAIYSPIKSMRDDQIKLHQAQMASLERVKNLAAQLQQSNASTSSSGGSLDGVIQSSMSRNNLRASGVDSSGKNGVRVRIDSAKFEDLLAWLYELEIKQGMQIKELNVSGSTDAGSVSVNMRLHKD